MNEYDGAANKVKISRTEDFEMLEQRVSTSLEFGAERVMLNSLVVERSKGDEEEGISVAGLLLSSLFCKGRHGGRGSGNFAVFGVLTACARGERHSGVWMSAVCENGQLRG